MLYGLVYRYILARTDPEWIHGVAMHAIGTMGRSPAAPVIKSTIGRDRGPIERDSDGRITSLFGKALHGRLGMAAGQDKNATAILGTLAMGFAFTEIGTVTPQPQPGNDKPRLWRLLDERAFRNRMGFNNDGSVAVARRLAALRTDPRGRDAIVGVNIGKNKWVSPADAAADYRACAERLSPYADYLVINVSSPNTPGLRDLQAVESLRPIVRATRDAATSSSRRVPVLVKIAPDLSDYDVVAIAHMVLDEGLDGVVATNTTINHSHGAGGVSGAPVRKRALDVVRILRTELGPEPLIIGVGGIFTERDARDFLEAGADLLETLTGFVCEGPLMPGRINRALAG